MFDKICIPCEGKKRLCCNELQGASLMEELPATPAKKKKKNIL